MVKKEDLKKCLMVFLVVTAIFGVLLVMQRSGHTWFRPDGFQTAALCAIYAATLLWSLGLVGFHLPVAEGFLLLAIVQVTVFQFILPPASVPDELVHFFETYYFSGQLLGDPAPQRIPGTNNEMVVSARPEDAEVWSHLDNIPDRSTYRYFLHGNADSPEGQLPGDGESTITHWSLPIGPVAYLPGILGISLARLLGLSGLAMLYLGRFFMSLAYVLLCYWGVRKMPFAKSLLALVALIPMSLHLAASYSYDCTLLGTSIFWIGMVFYYAYEKETLRWYDIFPVLLTALVLSSAKVVYVLLIGLCLLIPAKKLGGKGKYALFLLGIAACTVGCVVLTSIDQVGGYVAPTAENANYTLGFIFADMPGFILRCLNTVWFFREFYFTSMLGGKLGWLEILCPQFMIWGVFLLLVVAAISWRDDQFCKNAFHRAWAVLLFLGVFGACLVAAMLWTKAGEPVFLGFQGRYLLPVLPLVMMGLGGWKKLNLKWNLDRALLLGMGAMNTMILINAFEVIATR